MKAVISIPTYNGQVSTETIGAVLYASKLGTCNGFQAVQSSLLPKCFNLLWLKALAMRKDGFTHFAMLHADIIPEAGWLDVLLDIAEAKKADVVSTIMAMKSNHGLTSTGIDAADGSTKWAPKRFTMKQLHRMTEKTFTHPRLLINTGLMVVDMRKPWAEQIVFRLEDAIINGEACSVPEDWGFSRQVRELGGTIYATREVRALHCGQAKYPNDVPWGEWEVDVNGEARLGD